MTEREKSQMKVLVTGTEGYLGCLLAPTLMGRGHEVIGVDTGYYRQGWLYNGVAETAKTLAELGYKAHTRNTSFGVVEICIDLDDAVSLVEAIKAGGSA